MKVLVVLSLYVIVMLNITVLTTVLVFEWNALTSWKEVGRRIGLTSWKAIAYSWLVYLVQQKDRKQVGTLACPEGTKIYL